MSEPLIDIRPDQWVIVRDILRKHVPQYDVWAFGSRAKWSAKEYSDLDLAVITDKPLSLSVSAALSDDFSESDLPFKVDVVDWATTSESFRKIIERDKVVVWRAAKQAGEGVASEWKTVPLEKLVEPDRSISYGIVQPGALAPNGVPIVRVTDVRNGRIATTDPLRVAPNIEASYVRTRLRGGELLLTLVGTVGETAVVPKSLNGWNVARAVAVIPVRREISAYWVQLALKTPVVRHIIDSRLNTTVQATLNLRDVAQLPIVLPPQGERERIAHILGTLDDKIELNRRMNETLEAMARALFKSWFVDFDPVRAKAEGRDPGLPKAIADLFPDSFEDSELGEIPKGWTAVPLYDIATYINGAAYAAFQPNDERQGLPIIKIAELKAGITTQTKFSAVQMPEKYRIAEGDILFSWSGNPDTSIDTFVWSHESAWLNQHIFRVMPHHQQERAFLLSTLKTLRPVFAEIARDKQTTGLGHVTVADMKRLLVARPDDRLIRAWEVVAGPLLKRTFQNEVEVQCISALRDTLLPKLISGELRVKAAA